MAQEVTLGGDRLGSGKKQTVELHNYGMNSFNLEQDWKSSMAPGVLYPCLKIIGTNHGTFDIDIDSFVRTIPTRGPLFGSFKLQVDLFAVPFRLYQGILHNNPTDIGLSMNQVYLPKMILKTIDGNGAPRAIGSNDDNYQVHESALLKYTGLSGWGKNKNIATSQDPVNSTRILQCVPQLAYYDIFKCYYSNKQESNAYVITPGNVSADSIKVDYLSYFFSQTYAGYITPYNEETLNIDLDQCNDIIQLTLAYTTENSELTEEIKEKILENQHIYIGSETEYINENINYYLNYESTISWKFNNAPVSSGDTRNTIQLTIQIPKSDLKDGEIIEGDVNKIYIDTTPINLNQTTAEIALTPFSLKNIDKMRYKLLATNELGSEFLIRQGNNDVAGEWDEASGEDATGLPYTALVKQTQNGITWNAFTMNGLVVKTYQSDLFNNWLESTYIDTITNLTKVDTTSGGFTMDTLNLQEKFYNLLNRIIVGGGTYEDWQEAVYGEGAVRKSETPMYIGGMSAEVMFEEVISSAETNIDNDRQALGSLGGKGTQVGKKGGTNIHCKCDEPSYIMAMVSLTPRIVQTQGNDWDITELDTLDDLHKPELDGIGFQDLMVEQFAWWNTALDPLTYKPFNRDTAGKQTAWINYQTAVDKAYGDFARSEGYAFMVLARNYEHGDSSHPFTVEDITTYIDPAKYNYAFAYSKLDAQNFWVQLHFKVTARRKMGAQQLPNL